MRILKILSRIRQGAPSLYFCLIFLILAELFMAVIAPLFIPEHIYLKLYLGKAASESTRRFLADKDEFLLYDSMVGWRNRPNVSRGDWHTDDFGSRSPHPINLSDTKPNRLLFLGDSRTNGGTGVKNSETIAAYIEDSLTQAINFGTMLYSLDQDYLAYESDLYHFNANIIVIGLPGDIELGLNNRYIPFRDHDEVNMPYFEPRFMLTDTGAALLSVPSKAEFGKMLDSADFLDSLKATDEYYAEFWQYKHFGLTPLASSAMYLFTKSMNLMRLIKGVSTISPLAEEVLHQMKKSVAMHHATSIFIVFPEQKQTFPSWWRAKLPDGYEQVIAELRREGFKILDCRQVLRDSHRLPWELYSADGIHLTPEGNRIVAIALRQLLIEVAPEVSGVSS
jgi:hypothetical protein